MQRAGGGIPDFAYASLAYDNEMFPSRSQWSLSLSLRILFRGPTIMQL